MENGRKLGGHGERAVETTVNLMIHLSIAQSLQITHFNVKLKLLRVFPASFDSLVSAAALYKLYHIQSCS